MRFSIAWIPSENNTGPTLNGPHDLLIEASGNVNIAQERNWHTVGICGDAAVREADIVMCGQKGAHVASVVVLDGEVKSIELPPSQLLTSNEATASSAG